MTPLLEVSDLVVDYGRGRHRFRAVDSVSFEIGHGETLGLVGESGSGKTTIAKVVAGLARATSGRVVLDGRPVAGTSTRSRRSFARTVQVVFQDPYSSLNPSRTIGQSLGEALLNDATTTRRERQRRAEEMLERVGLPADLARAHPAHLSGGQRQRVAIARALMLEPKLVICDEPVSALDLSVQAQILNLLADLQDDLGLSYLFVAHNLSVVRHIAHRVMVLYRGRVMEHGATRAVYDSPAHPYTQALLASEPVADPDRQRARRTARPAALPSLGAAVAALEGHGGPGCVFLDRCPVATAECRVTSPSLENWNGHQSACLLPRAAVPHFPSSVTTDPK